MNKAKDILEKLKQRREIADAVRAYWADVLPDIGLLPEPQLQSWLGKFDLDAMIAGLDAAVTQRSKRDAKGDPMTAAEAVNFASAVMNRLHLEGLPEAEREALKATKDRIREARSAAGKRGNEKRWHSESEVATTCDNLRSLATPLPPSYSSSVSVAVSSSSLSSSLDAASSSSSNDNIPPQPEEKSKDNTQTKTNGVRDVLANQRQNQKTKTCKKCGATLEPKVNHTCPLVKTEDQAVAKAQGGYYPGDTGCYGCGKLRRNYNSDYCQACWDTRQKTKSRVASAGNSLGVPEL